jgi:hypothetical protein
VDTSAVGVCVVLVLVMYLVIQLVRVVVTVPGTDVSALIPTQS